MSLTPIPSISSPSQTPSLTKPVGNHQQLHTEATLLELIEQKFFSCETRIRENLMQLMTPYKKKSDANFETCQILMEDSHKVQK